MNLTSLPYFIAGIDNELYHTHVLGLGRSFINEWMNEWMNGRTNHGGDIGLTQSQWMLEVAEDDTHWGGQRVSRRFDLLETEVSRGHEPSRTKDNRLYEIRDSTKDMSWTELDKDLRFINDELRDEWQQIIYGRGSRTFRGRTSLTLWPQCELNTLNSALVIVNLHFHPVSFLQWRTVDYTVMLLHTCS